MTDRRGLAARLSGIELNPRIPRIVPDDDDEDDYSEEDEVLPLSAMSNATLGLEEEHARAGPEVSAHLMNLVHGGAVSDLPPPRRYSVSSHASRPDLPARFSASIFPDAPAGLRFVDAETKRAEIEAAAENEGNIYEYRPVNIDRVIRNKRKRRKYTLTRDEDGLHRKRSRDAKSSQRRRRRRIRQQQQQQQSSGRNSSQDEVAEEMRRWAGKNEAISESSFFADDDDDDGNVGHRRVETDSTGTSQESTTPGEDEMGFVGEPLEMKPVPLRAMIVSDGGECRPRRAEHSSTTVEPSSEKSDQNRRRGSRSPYGGGERRRRVMPTRTRVEESGDDDDECFLCMFGNVKYDAVVSEKMDGLWSLFADNYFGMTDTQALAATLYSYYLEEIYEPAIAEGQKLPRWSIQGVYHHITEHMGEPRIFVGESIKTLQALRRAMMPFAMKQLGENEFEPNTRVVAEIRQLTKQIQELYKSEVQDMFGFCDAFKADPRMMNRFVHMSRVVVEKKSHIDSAHGTYS